MKKELIANVITFTLVLVLGLSALLFGYMGLRPGTGFTTITMQLPRAAQLVTGSSVLLHGVRVGTVTAVRGTADGVDVALRYPSRYRVPTASAISIEQLSALGEPYIEFAPNSSSGPYLNDGAVLDRTAVAVPASIPEIFRSLANVARLTDAGPLSALIKTAWEATAGTEAQMPTLIEAGDILAATVMSRMPAIRTMFAQSQLYSGDLAWLPPALPKIGTPFRRTTDAVRKAIDRTRDMVVELGMPAPLLGVAHPFVERLDPYLADLLPKVAEILGPSVPILAALDRTAPQIDVSSLLSSALAIVGPDGAARITVTIPTPR